MELNARKKNKENGFTLIELLLYISLASLILLAVSSVMVTTFEIRQKEHLIGEVEEQGALAAYTIENYLRGARSIISPIQNYSQNHFQIDRTVAQGNSSVQIFEKEGVLFVQEGAETPQVLTTSPVQVTEVEFKNISLPNTKGLIEYHFTLTASDASGRAEYHKSFTGGAAVR